MKKLINRTALLILQGCLAINMANCGHNGDTHSEHSGHTHEEGEVMELELSEKQLKTVGIELGSLMNEDMGGGITVNGVLAVNPQDMADVTPLLSGVVREIFVKEGDHVTAGQSVARIENMDVVTYRQSYADAQLRLGLAQQEYERQKQLASHGAGIAGNLKRTETELQVCRNAVSSLEQQMHIAGIKPSHLKEGTASAVVKAPISGVISRIFLHLGNMADMSAPVMTITDNSKVFAQLKVYEKDLDKIKTGETVDLSLTNGDGKLKGRVAEVNPTLNAETKTADIRVVLTETDNRRLIPGMAVNGTVNLESRPVTALPEEAVVLNEGKNYIYVLESSEEEDGEMMYRFKAIEVVTGLKQRGYVEVTPLVSLSPDTRVVVSKAFYLASMSADHGEHNH